MSFGGFGTFGSTPAPSFGGGGGFGAPAAQQPAFGAPAASTGFGGFGQTAAAPAQPSGGLFGTASTGFGAPAFGAPAAAAPAAGAFSLGGGFGAPAQQPASTGFGGFGQTATDPNQAAGGAFGGFGQAAQPASTGFGGFGQPATQQPAFGAPSSSGFGTPATQPAFGAPAASTGFGGFGQSAAAPSGGLFGQTAAPAFGAPAAQPSTGFGLGAPSSSGFGATGFGAQPQQAASTGFGTSSFGLGGAPAGEQKGTRHRNFAPLTEESTVKAADGSTTRVRSVYQSITCMAEYQNKTFEELRIEDEELGLATYTGQQAAPAAGGSLFGTASTGFGAPAASSSLFGAPAQQPAASTGFGGFGATAQPSSSLFGAPAAQPAASTGFGGFGATATPSTSGFGGFGATATPAPATTGFGGFGTTPAPAASTGFGGFGATAAPAASSTGFGSSLFGATGSGLGATQAGASSSSLFGATAPAASTGFGGGFGGFGTTAAPAATTSSFSLGGSTAAPTSSLFGATATPAPATGGFGGFGTTAAAPAASTGFGGFGATAPAATTTGFGGFGATGAAPTTTGFGATASAGTGFGGFGASTGGFGTTAAAPATGGLFGTTAAPAASSTGFGSFGGFGATTAAPAPAAGGFGGFSLGGTTAPAAGAATTGGFGSLFGATAPAAVAPVAGAAPIGQQLVAKVDENSFLASFLDTSAQAISKTAVGLSQSQAMMGSSTAGALGANQIAGGLPLLVGSHHPSTPRLVGASTALVHTPHSAARLRPRAFLASPSPARGGLGGNLNTSLSLYNGGAAGLASPGVGNMSITSQLGSSFHSSAPLTGPTAVPLTPELLVSRRNLRKLSHIPLPQIVDLAPLVEDEKTDEKPPRIASSGTATPAPAHRNNSGIAATPSPYRVVEEDSLYPNLDRARSRDATPVATYSALKRDTSRLASPVVPPRTNPALTKDDRAALPTLTRAGYTTSPPLADLALLTRAQLEQVSNFAVHHATMGSVSWEGLTDVTDLALDEIVLFERNEKTGTCSVEVYPLGSDIPPVGHKLNHPAIITVQQCWPTGYIAGEDSEDDPATERKMRKYEKKLRAATERAGAEFLTYSSEKGTWSFRVQSFS